MFSRQIWWMIIFLLGNFLTRVEFVVKIWGVFFVYLATSSTFHSRHHILKLNFQFGRRKTWRSLWNLIRLAALPANLIKDFQNLLLLHPDCPGTRILIWVSNFLLRFPNDFCTFLSLTGQKNRWPSVGSIRSANAKICHVGPRGSIARPWLGFPRMTEVWSHHKFLLLLSMLTCSNQPSYTWWPSFN